MKSVRKNIWDFWGKPNNIVLVTTNNVGGRNGLVMGAGIALQAQQRIPELPMMMLPYANKDYGLVVFPEYSIGCLQTKRHWKDKSPLDLIEFSLQTLALTATSATDWNFYLPKPGCGLGGLSWELEVEFICKRLLPDNCIVCI
jgi:hypothetical protein